MRQNEEKMKKHYLIDFENVSDDGLKGYFELSPEDTVEIFYTENAARIGIDFLENCLAAPERAALRFIKVPAGKQSLDMQLATYLGALLAGDGAPDAEYCIVSKDKGFASIRQFWQSRRPGAVIRLQRMIRPDGQPQNAGQQKPSETQNGGQQKPAEPQNAGQTKQPEAQSGAQQRPADQQTSADKLNQGQPKQSEAQNAQKADQQTPGDTRNTEQKTAAAAQSGGQSSAAEEQNSVQQNKGGKKKDRQKMPEATSQRNGQTKTAGEAQQKNAQNPAEMQNAGKPEANAADPAKVRIAAALQKGGIDESVADSVWLLAQSLRGAPAPLRDIYQGIVKKYGQKKGLAIYNQVKSELKQLV